MVKNIKYKKILLEDKIQVENLIKQVTNNLVNKEFFIPIEEEEFLEFFDEKNCIVFGAFDNEKLVGIAKLDFLDKYLKELKDIINLNDYKVAELGRYLVLEEYRNNGIMFNLQNLLIKEANNLKFNYIIATVHPENIASNKVIIKSGMQLNKTVFLNNGYYRHIYVKKI